MSDDDMPDPRETAQQIGVVLDREELVNEIMAGKMSAEDAAPLLAGIIDQAIVMMFMPVVQATDVVRFNAAIKPLLSTVRMKDGTVLAVEIKAVPR